MNFTGSPAIVMPYVNIKTSKNLKKQLYFVSNIIVFPNNYENVHQRQATGVEALQKKLAKIIHRDEQ